MSPVYVDLIGVGITFLQSFLGSLTKNKASQEVLDAVQATIAALQAHQQDVMSKADWEAQRG